jgi:hypothetical protein
MHALRSLVQNLFVIFDRGVVVPQQTLLAREPQFLEVESIRLHATASQTVFKKIVFRGFAFF